MGDLTLAVNKRVQSSASQIEPEGPTITLDRVPESRRALVLCVMSDQGANRRLAQLGIVTGEVVEVRRSAPLGGPILVEAHGSTVALGRRLAAKVFVRVLPFRGNEP
jgi:Fe2+ transport system protein FeoA